MLETLLPLINSHPHNVYTETFLGGGSVFWHKNPSQIETINDHNDFVVNFYEVVKSDFEKLRVLIDSSLISRTHKNRANLIWKEGGDKIDRAWAFWYLANFSHSSKLDGGLKYSNEIYSSVPKQLSRKKADFTNLLVQRIENAVIENRDAIWVLETRNKSDALHFIDPPYIGADQGHYRGYTKADAIKLLDFLSSCRGAFIMTCYEFPELIEFADRQVWNLQRLDTPIYALNGKRRKTEVIVSNFQHNQFQMDFN